MFTLPHLFSFTPAQIVVFDDWRRETSRFLIALFRVKTINLVELATGFRSKAKTEAIAFATITTFFPQFQLRLCSGRKKRKDTSNIKEFAYLFKIFMLLHKRDSFASDNYIIQQRKLDNNWQ